MNTTIIHWYSTQKTVAFSTMEADYMAAVEAGKEILWMKDFIDQLRPLHDVEYQCIMDVFTLSSLIAQVRAIYVISIKGSCPK